MVDSRDVIMAMRYMEWERVKGGLHAILTSYQSEEGEIFNTAHDIASEFMAEFGEKAGID